MRLFSVSEAAQKLSLSVNTIYGLCRARKLRHERHGLGRGVIRVPEDAIEEYRRGATVPTTQAGAGPVGRPSPPRKKAAPLRRLSLD
jgi:excisionase family DNA binding protein